MEFQKTISSLETIPDNKDLVKNKLKFMINEKKNTVITKKIGYYTFCFEYKT